MNEPETLCSSCARDSQCRELPYCGGAAWSPRFVGCDMCGERIDKWNWSTYRQRGARHFCKSCFESASQKGIKL